MDNVAIICNTDGVESEFVEYKFTTSLKLPEGMTLLNRLGAKGVSRAAKQLGVKCYQAPRGYKPTLPLVAFWDGVDPMVKRVITDHLKAKVCVRVIRTDDEDNVKWKQKLARNAVLRQPLKSV